MIDSTIKVMAVGFYCISVILFMGGNSGAQEGEIVIGLNIPLSGSYSLQGKDEADAYKLAIERINERGGILGKKLTYVIKDTKTSAKTARENTVALIREHNAVMVTGGSSSSVAIAQSDVCQENGRIFMAALTHSNATTGHMKNKAGFVVQKAHRHTFRWYFNAWMTGKALGPFLVERFGTGSEYYYITADYTWGHSLEESLRWITEMAGCDTIGAVRTPLGQKTFQKELLAAKKARPDILVLVLFGQDLITALKQADQLGIKKKTKIVVPLMELNMAHGVGPDVLNGVYATVNWYWGLGDRFPGTKTFVDSFRSRYGKAPGSSAAAAWVAINQWASAVERAGTVDSGSVIKALEGHNFTLLKDEEKWRSWDHQAISSVYVVTGKSRAEAKGPWDLLKIVDEKKGEDVMRSMEENPVIMEPL